MITRIISISALSLGCVLGLSAQSLSHAQAAVEQRAALDGKKALTLDACFSPRLYPSGLGNVAWRGESENIAFVDYSQKTRDLKNKNALSGVESVLITADSFLSWYGLPYFPALHWINENRFWFQSKSGIQFHDLIAQTGEKGIEIPSGTQALEISSDGRQAAYILDNQLFINSNSFTQDGGQGIVYGQSVHRNEFGIEKGLFWSPKASLLAFYRMDEIRVTDYPLVDLNQRPAKHEAIPYPMAGDSSHTVKIGIANPATGSIVYLDCQGPYDQYLTNITWSPDEKSIYVFVVNRGQDTCRLEQFSSQTGQSMGTLFTQISTRYVEPEHGLEFLPGSNTDFLFFSEYSGYNHLWLYSSKGKSQLDISPVGYLMQVNKGAVKPLTSGNWEVMDFLGFGAKPQQIAFTASKESPLCVDAYTLDWSSKLPSTIRLTQGNAVHSISASLCNFSKSLFIDVASSVNNPRSYSAHSMFWKSASSVPTPMLLFEANNPTEEYSMARMEMGQMEHEGNTLYTRTFYPSDFDPSKKYPVVCYLYGGPHAQMIQNRWMGGANLWFHYMAQAGYIVYTVDNRGSSHRGLAFEQATFRNLGTVEMQDQLAVLNLFKSQPYVDSTRCGVHGWSFGGFMTTSLMTREAGAFKVGVAGGPVIDWNYYEIMYTERYMDRPSENPDGYAANSLLNHADKLAGRLLMIHGTLDNVVLWQHSQLFVEQCVKKGVTGLDYFIYPGHEHNVIGPDRAHLYKKVSQYFFEHL